MGSINVSQQDEEGERDSFLTNFKGAFVWIVSITL